MAFAANNDVIVEVVSFAFANAWGAVWNVKHRTAMFADGGNRQWECEGLMYDVNLRPLSGVPLDDETPIETNIPEAMQLALGIQARVWA
jgi:hypothetical protein